MTAAQSKACVAAIAPPLLTLAGLLLWCVDRVGAAELALSAGAAGAAGWWLARQPMRATRTPGGEAGLLLTVCVLVAAVVADVWLLVAIAWTAATAVWVHGFLPGHVHRRLRPWWPAVAMLVPWVWADGQWIGWQMRMSGAATAEAVLGFCFEGVSRSGTTVSVSEVDLNVSAACAGLSTLQLFLAAGLACAAVRFQRLTGVLAAAPVVVAFAWTVNTARIVALGLIAGGLSPEYATGTAHDLLGWVALAVAAGLASQILPKPTPAAAQ